MLQFNTPAIEAMQQTLVAISPVKAISNQGTAIV